MAVLSKEESGKFLEFLCSLDQAAPWMYYSPGERVQNVRDMRGHIAALRPNSAIMVSWQDDRIVGYLAVYGGRQSRVAHVGSLSCGVLAEVRRHGIARELFSEWLSWNFATGAGIHRVELTVVTENLPAVKLYLALGFKVEGLRKMSFYNGSMWDEYHMAKYV